MDGERSDRVDPLTAALARLPLEISGQGELDRYVNDLILEARRSLGQNRRTQKRVLVRRGLRSA